MVLIGKIETGEKQIKKVPVSANEKGRDGPFIAYDNGTVHDTRTGLMWPAKDNQKEVTWEQARKYCENYTGGGYTDWRMPTQGELEELYDKNKKNWFGNHVTKLIGITKCCPYASETRGSEAAYFNFYGGYGKWVDKLCSTRRCALPVRNAR